MKKLAAILALSLLGSCASLFREDPEPIDYYHDLVNFRAVVQETLVAEWLPTASEEEQEKYLKVSAVLDSTDKTFQAYLYEPSAETGAALLSALEVALLEAHSLVDLLTEDEDKARWAKSIIALAKGIVLSLKTEIEVSPDMIRLAESLPQD